MKKTLAIAGCGKLGNIVAEAVLNGLLPDYELIATCSRTFDKAKSIAEKFGMSCKPCENIDELLEVHPDYIVEAASPACMKEIAIPALEIGINIVTLSVGAFAEDSFYEAVKEAAVRGSSKVYVASGATGGFDVLRTATLMGNAKAKFFNEKGPAGLKGTCVFDESLYTEQKTVFQGTATEAIAKFPTKVNVTVAASRASVGPENMQVTIQSSPDFKGDTQRVEITNDQVHAIVDIYSRTAEIAAWSVVRILQNITSPIVF